MWESLVRPIVSVHRLVLLLPDMYRLGSGQGHWQRRQQSEQMDQGGNTY